MRSSLVFPVTALAILLASLPVAAQGTMAIHGASDADYQKWVQDADKAKARVIWVHAFGAGPRFNGIAVNDGTNPPSVSRHNLTAAAYQKEFTAWTGKGYRPVSISGYTRGGATNFAVAFVKDGLPVHTDARHGQTSAEYNAHFAAMTKKGFRPIVVNGYAEGKSHRFVSIFINDGKPIFGYHDLTAADFQRRFDEHTPQGFRPTSLNVYPTAQGPRFAVVFTKGPGPAYALRHGLTAAEYQKEFVSLNKNGFVPKQVVGYNSGGDRYAFIFEAPSKPVTYPLPMQGFTVAKYKPYDDAMQSFMKDRGFTGGTLAVRKDNILLHSRGYGYRDHGITPMSPDTPMRIASISKPITLAAIRKLLAAGTIKTDTKVVDYLSITPPAGKTMDARWKDITIQHLIDHKGGFNRDKSGDPMFESVKISKALGKTGPASANDVITYMAGQPLDFKPGSETQYSNFGFCLLGRVIEKASGQSYINYIKSAFVIPLKLNSTDLGRTLVPFRNPKEPFYMYDSLTSNVMKPGTGNVPWPDGGFHLEAMDAHGGLVSSAQDLSRWGSHYWVSGQPRTGGSQEWLSFGSLPGNWSVLMQRPDGTVITALFNHRTETSEKVSPDVAIADRLKKANEATK